MHALHSLGLRFDGDRVVHHPHEQIVRLRLVGHARHLNGERVRVQQDARLQRLNDQPRGSGSAVAFAGQFALTPSCLRRQPAAMGARPQIGA